MLEPDEDLERVSVDPRPPQDLSEMIILLVMLIPVTAKKYQHSGVKLSAYIFSDSSLYYSSVHTDKICCNPRIPAPLKSVAGSAP